MGLDVAPGLQDKLQFSNTARLSALENALKATDLVWIEDTQELGMSYLVACATLLRR